MDSHGFAHSPEKRWPRPRRDGLAGVIDASWQEVYGQRVDDFRLPGSDARRAELAVRYGRDGYLLLRQVHGPGAPGWLRNLPAVQALRRIWRSLARTRLRQRPRNVSAQRPGQ